MTMEEDSINQATSARRERLKALRAAKEFANMPDGYGAAGHNNLTETEYSANDFDEKITHYTSILCKWKKLNESSVFGKESFLCAFAMKASDVNAPDQLIYGHHSLTNAYFIRKIGSIEEDSTELPSAARRERLIGLRTTKELLSTTDDGSKHIYDNAEDSEDALENEAPNMKFRNYLPHDQRLQEGKLSSVELPKFEDPIAPVPQSDKMEDPFVNIAPKKPNWDLRRDVQKRLDKLERRTQKALYELMLEQEKEKAAMELENGGDDD
ncbi:hypothetical protein AXF42_Ash013990 [Apostasia shenzhenica]|uniref:Coiled-coil domain-containing protein 12 n=1 Tax=Apostasia shenzhenica TaxID=1088818 RepID=A0A2I0A909_9ASPA|nr:hypothetical protein AXF42_Ash013990 [Apostasia shenzhenica]